MNFLQPSCPNCGRHLRAKSTALWVCTECGLTMEPCGGVLVERSESTVDNTRVGEISKLRQRRS